KNIGILITDHNVNETLSICDRAYLLIDGKIFQHGTAEELAGNEQVRRLYLGRNFELKRKDWLLEQGKGAIVNTGSILGYRTVGERAAYASSKGAIDTLTRTMAFDLAQNNIRVNCVVPGAIDTPLLRGSINDSPDPEATEKF
ncbi:MAG: SDR family NAD(P)-dependent oxidoreductase, partial [Bacteroidia bacterium]|nr:SDR family NAD(P)-dependent oxidoreductase [Bacteroidia bacterium]